MLFSRFTYCKLWSSIFYSIHFSDRNALSYCINSIANGHYRCWHMCVYMYSLLYLQYGLNFTCHSVKLMNLTGYSFRLRIMQTFLKLYLNWCTYVRISVADWLTLIWSILFPFVFLLKIIYLLYIDNVTIVIYSHDYCAFSKFSSV